MDDLTWLLDSDEPWTRFRALADLLARPASDPRAVSAKSDLVAHPQVRALIATASKWGTIPLKRHNDAAHPIYAISTLADFGLRADDPGMDKVIAKILAHQSPEGAFQTVVNIPTVFGGTGEDAWTWIACDAPTLLYSLLAFGLGDDPRVKKAVAHLAGLVEENGFRCVATKELGKFHGPGRRADPCPVVNVYALKALALVPGQRKGKAARAAAEMLLDQWEHRKEKKYYLFGMGTNFKKLKYPFVYFDILHVLEALSRLPFVHADPRYQEMLATVTAQADAQGRFTAGSMYQSWKGWSFADKKNPSPWLTMVVRRLEKRSG